ncbi:hypothetical protein A0256_16145 [Mucilaginibacter sp. PAMC 26640]|nr:hypothetical protein A0256_16145 [Mucilaginibacter sp. PAMC 26640]
MNWVKAIGTVVSILIVFGGFTVYGQSNQGKEFWTGYMSHVESTGKSQMSLYITGGVNTTGKVEIADGSYAIPFTIKANQVTTVEIPRSAFMKNQGQFLKGIHITSQKNIAVYAHIYASSVSGATLLLPVTSLGKSYYSINYTQASNSDSDTSRTYSSFMVVATEDNTTVEIIPSADLLNGIPAGATITLNLRKGEVYQGLSLIDLTNTVIRAKSTTAGECKRIAVFSGSTKIGIGCRQAGFTSDNLFQQVYPTASWGKNYITVPLKSRGYDIIRIICSADNTNVKVNGLNTFQPVRGLFDFTFSSRETNVISADKPIQVVQYAVSQGQTLGNCTNNSFDVGDPEMIYLTPTEQTLDHVTLYSTPNYDIINNYINIVIKTSQTATFVLDGKPYTNFTPVSADPSFSYAQINVSQGTHNISAADGFNAIAYGFGNAESYGYAAGANLKNLNQFIDLQNNNNTQALATINGCRDVEYKLHLTLPYPTTNIKWNLNDGTPDYVDANPQVAYTTVQTDGKVLYNYNYYKSLKFIPGDYSITATVLNPNSDVCGVTTDIDFDFNIADYPEPKFTFEGNCPGDTTYFNDVSDAKGDEVKTWLWDFGDGQTSSLQNPKHIFADKGTYNVILTATNLNGCSSISPPLKVLISDRPIAAFDISSPNCVGGDVLFTDRSTSATSKIVKWVWDFGDKTTETHADNKPFTHLYKNTGRDTVRLTLWDDKGCSSAAYFKILNITPLPQVDFTLPDACVNDLVEFTDKSIIADGSEADFTYRWNFGDDMANSIHPNTGIGKTTNHQYAHFGVYTVTLTVTSAAGCSSTRSQQFTVNGAQPAAKFTTQDKDKLCSSNPVTFKEASTVNFGRITKFVWYYDYDGDRADVATFDKDVLPANRIYLHSYPVFNAPATKTYKVHMEAYSGESCVDIAEDVITINANPVVNLPQVGRVCQDAKPFLVIPETNGFIGTGVFTGSGISPAGLFTPASAGTGVVTITYLFTGQNGCDYTTSTSITVNPVPTVDAGGNTGLLEGGIVKLPANAKGKSLSYKWTPATGLDHDDVLKPICSATDDITYKLTVTSEDGCTAADEISVKVLKKLTIINTFTPNGDGVNDTWTIKYLETYPGNKVNIYNRYGEKVYSSVGYGNPWDGTYKGSNLPVGTYYYIIDPGNGVKVVSGSVTIIR